MTTIIRRYRRHRLAPPLTAVAATIVLLAVAIWFGMVIWTKGGPQPLHEIVIALPAPHTSPAAGWRT